MTKNDAILKIGTRALMSSLAGGRAYAKSGEDEHEGLSLYFETWSLVREDEPLWQDGCTRLRAVDIDGFQYLVTLEVDPSQG